MISIAKKKPVKTERQRDADRKSVARAADRDLAIPKVANVRRRRECLADPYKFLKTYFPDIFSQPFTADRKEMIDAIYHAARYGGDQAVAGPRGDGKTRSALFCILALALGGFVSFPMIISKSGPRAARELRNLKEAVQGSQKLLEDFPEVVLPIVKLGRWSSRARQQTVYGQYSDLEWGEECIVFPTVPTTLLRANGWNRNIESAARGQIIASLGIEGPIRGYSVRNRRPDVAILDDIDDRESARSELQTDNRARIIEEDIGGLAGPDQTIARVMLCTLINRTCIAATYTDRAKKPSWRGQRHRLVEKFSEREDIGDQYIQLRQNRTADDADARVAYEFYLAHQAEIEASVVVTNPYRYDKRILSDGRQAEVSAYQAALNLIADRGLEHFNTEYQNDPPLEEGPVESGITAHRVQSQVNGYARCIIPPECKILTQGIDCQKRGLYWVVRAWRADGTGFTIDYNFTPTFGTTYGSDVGVDKAIQRALLMHMEAMKSREFMTIDGELRPIDLTLVDAGYETNAVYQACIDIRLGIMPAMGYGKSGGVAGPNFSPGRERRPNFIPGDNWNCQEVNKLEWPGLWRVDMDADRWKSWEHDRWMTVPSLPGAMTLFGSAGENHDRLSKDQQEHMTYARHITAEVVVEEFAKTGHRISRWLNKHSRPNHYLDASYMANVAASIKGIRLLKQAPSESSPRKSTPESLLTSQPTNQPAEERPFLASAR